jgi:hypothetical protein
MASHVRSAPDDPDAPGKDQGAAVGGDGPPDSPRASLDSAIRIERTVAYRAAVDIGYRQYAIDHGYAGRSTEAAELENLRVPDRTIEHDGRMRDHSSDFYMVAQLASSDPVVGAAAADHALTGARGPASGREFDPETAGGPIQQLDAREARITNEGVEEVAAHLQRFTGGGSLQAPEQGMLDRLASIAAGDIEPTCCDLNFFTHELDESSRYAQLGFGPESGVDLGSAEMYEVWNDVHTAALEDYGISDADLFHPGLAP